MTHRFSLFILALGLALAACDTNSPPDTLDGEGSAVEAAVDGFDADVVALASQIGDSDSPDPAPFELRAVDRPLLRFDTAEDLDRMSTALETIAKSTGEPLTIHSNLAAYTGTEYDLAAPKGALSLTDRLGRVVVDDQVFTLRSSEGGVETVVTAAASGAVVETFPVKAFATEGRIEIPGGLDQESGQARIRFGGEDEFRVYGPDTVTNNDGETRYVWQVFAHSAYRTSFGAKKANAQSEVVASEYEFFDPFTYTGGFEGAYEANTDEFDYQVTARVYTEHYGCKSYYGASPTYPGARIYVNAGGARGTGQGVYKSRHTGPVGRPGVPDSRTSVTIDGEGGNQDCWG